MQVKGQLKRILFPNNKLTVELGQFLTHSDPLRTLGLKRTVS